MDTPDDPGLISTQKPTPGFPLGTPLAWLLPALSLALLLVIIATDSNQPLFFAINSLSPVTGEALWVNLTVLGDGLIVFVLILSFAGRRPDVVWALLVTALLTALATYGLKALFPTARPPALLAHTVFHIIGPAFKANSFPSGHTATAFAFAGVLSLLLRRPLITTLLIGAASLVGISRIVVGVHWPLDVLAGAMTGWLCAVGGIAIAQRGGWGMRATAQQIFAVMLAAAAGVLLTYYQTGYEAAIWLQRIIALLCIALLVSQLPKIFNDKK
jgi:membrane-associated phospholipid phosphatase